MNDGLKEGLVHIYTGDGKGKTTAAVGLAVRAAGHGKEIYIAQFMKKNDSGETKALRHFHNIHLFQFGNEGFVEKGNATEDDICLAQEGYASLLKAVTLGYYDLVVMDEIICAINWDLLSLDQVLRLIDEKRKGLELVLTGRDAPQELIERADYVSRIDEVKHPYATAGVLARAGIEH
jgi:cob(I)alamin adenosyltransferase